MIANDAWVTPLLVSSALNFEYTSSGVTKYRRTFFPKSLVLTLFKPFTYTIVRSHALGMDTLLTLIPFDHLYSSLSFLKCHLLLRFLSSQPCNGTTYHKIFIPVKRLLSERG